MKIKKLGHCCLYIEVNGTYILTDPGMFSYLQNAIKPVDIILITHEHADHFHLNSLKLILENNPKARIITNTAVGLLLAKDNIDFTILEGGDPLTILGVSIQAFAGKHEEIFASFGQVQNTGYLLAGRFFYPGDSFDLPGCSVDILALPVAGPWCKLPDAIAYALAIKPKVAFPVHDGMIIPERIGSFHLVPQNVLKEHGIEFIAMLEGDEISFN